jgi:Uma2 family endonuclease
LIHNQHLTLKNPLPRADTLPYDDGEPLESDWHMSALGLLIQLLRYHWRERHDVYIGGNMFIYFDPAQVKRRNFRGPDFFVVKGVKSNHFRQAWVLWEEDNRAPDFVIELASASTLAFDLGGKREIYEQQLKTPEYVVYDPASEQLYGWRLNAQGRYSKLAPDARGWLWSEQLELWVGVTDHTFPNQNRPYRVVRFFDSTGRLVPTEAEAATQRAQAAEAEIARLQALLKQKP